MTTAEQLLAVLGDHAFRRLTHAFGGRVLRVPTIGAKSRSRRRTQRDAQIMQFLNCPCGNDRHHSYRAIARRFSLSGRSVVRIGKRWPLLPS